MGDSFAGGSVVGGTGDDGWPALLSARMGWPLDRNGLGWSVVGGTGFVQAGSKRSFVERIPDVIRANPEIVVVAGGANDYKVSDYATEKAAAASAFSQLRTGLPNATIIVVGPFSKQPIPPNVSIMRDAIFSAATENGLTNLVDPLPWFEGSRIEISGDGVHPTDAGHKVIAELMYEAIAPIVPQ